MTGAKFLLSHVGNVSKVGLQRQKQQDPRYRRHVRTWYQSHRRTGFWNVVSLCAGVCV